MMKRCLALLTILTVAFSAFSFAAAEKFDVTADVWMASDGMTMEFHKDGTVAIRYANGKTDNVTWDMDGNVLKCYYEYELWGTKQKYGIVYYISETDGHLQIIHDGNDRILYPKDIMEEVLEQAKGKEIHPEQITLGETVSTGFVEIQTDHMMATRKLKSATVNTGISRSPQTEASILFCLCGNISNIGMEEIQLGTMYVTFILDDGTAYSGGSYTEYDDTGLQEKLPVLCDGNLWLYAEIPMAELEKASGCTVRLCFDEDMTMVPLYPEAANYIYDIVIGSEQMKLDEDEIKRNPVFFDDFPSLPTPESFADVYISSSSRSSSGKSKQGTYKYRAYDDSKTGKDILDAYLKGLEAYPAFSVEKKGNGYTVREGKKTLMTVHVEDNQLIFEYKN